TTETVAITPDATRAVSGGWDGVVRMWDLEAGQMLHSWSASNQGSEPMDTSPEEIHISPDGARVLSRSRRGEIVLWDANTGQSLRRWTGSSDNARVGVATPDWRYLVRDGRDGIISVVQVETAQSVRRWAKIKSRLDFLSIARNGRKIVAGVRKGRIWLWDFD